MVVFSIWVELHDYKVRKLLAEGKFYHKKSATPCGRGTFFVRVGKKGQKEQKGNSKFKIAGTACFVR